MAEHDNIKVFVGGHSWEISVPISTEHLRHLVHEIENDYPVTEEEAAKGHRLEISGPVTGEEQRRWLKRLEEL